MMIEDLLQRHLAVQLAVHRDEDGPQAAAGMRAEHAEPLAVAGGGADGVGSGAVEVGVGLGGTRAGADVGQGGVDLRVAESGQLIAGGAADGDRRQTVLGVATMLLQVQRDHRLDAGSLLGVEVTMADEVNRQRSALIAGPRLKGGHELHLIDQAVLEREQAEEQVARGVDRTGHDRQLPRLLSLTKKAGKVQHMLQRRVVAARRCNYNEVPARLLGLPFPRRILGPGADGTTGAWHTFFWIGAWGFAIGGVVLGYYAAYHYIPAARAALREGRASRAQLEVGA